MSAERVVLDGQLVVRESSGALPRLNQRSGAKRRRAASAED
jgi:hypothetical protein